MAKLWQTPSLNVCINHKTDKVFCKAKDFIIIFIHLFWEVKGIDN